MTGSGPVREDGGARSTARKLVFAITWWVSVIYVAGHLDNGWIPHDDGALAHSAERVLSGELPHGDFDEIYTGGLSYVNALALAALGANLISLRVVLFALFLLWVPALYYIATRFASALASAPVVLLAVAWSLPNYSAAMPSWYNLYFAVFGVAALLRYLETEKARWLLMAGACGGLSLLVKIVGLYFVSAALLFLVFREQCLSRQNEDAGSERGGGYAPLIGFALLIFLLLLLVLVRDHLRVEVLVHFVLPGACLVAFLIWSEWSDPVGGTSRRYAVLFRLVAPFAVGMSIPVALFLVPYVLRDSLVDLLSGVFLLPTRRLSGAIVRPPEPATMLVAIPIAVLIGLEPRLRSWMRWIVGAGLALGLGAVLVMSENEVVYRAVWYSMRPLVPLVMMAGIWIVWSAKTVEERTACWRQKMLALLSVTGMCSLVQFPFSHPVYFFYIAPLAAICALAVVSSQARCARPVFGAVLVFYLLFAAGWVHTGFVYQMGSRYVRYDHTEVLALGRGGPRVTPWEKMEYEQLVAVLRSLGEGGFTYATPDSPEVYFLSGLRNPTRTIFEMFDDPEDRTNRVLEALEQEGVRVITINRIEEFYRLPPELVAELQARFPHSAEIGRFLVRWRD